MARAWFALLSFFLSNFQLWIEKNVRCALQLTHIWTSCSSHDANLLFNNQCGIYVFRTRVFTLSFVPNRVCNGVRLTEKKDCRLPACWNTRSNMDYYDDLAPSYALQDTLVSCKIFRGYMLLCIMHKHYIQNFGTYLQ